MSRPKGENTKDLPPNLSIKKGIYYYKNPLTGKSKSRGKIKALAVTEAIHANLKIYKPKDSLLDWIEGVKKVTLHEWLDEYLDIINSRGLKAKTVADYKSKINIIKCKLEDIDIQDITPKRIADFINNYEGASMAKLLRSTLSDAFNEAIAGGLVNNNPVSVTRPPKTKVARSRIELDQFMQAVSNAKPKYGYVFLLSLLTGQRIGDITRLKWEDIKDNRIYIEQSKTGARIAIPLSLRLAAINLSIQEVLDKLDSSSSLICNVTPPILRDNLNKALPYCDSKPTYHEIRSLSARLYELEKGADFAKKLLGHKSMVMTDKYLDNRNNSFLEL